jgi:hypothetical protein
MGLMDKHGTFAFAMPPHWTIWKRIGRHETHI